jgi:hypothetical protein
VFSYLPTLASTTLPVSLFFWGWAVKNTLKATSLLAEAKAKGETVDIPPFDLGVVSFLTSALSSSFLLGAGTNGISSFGRWMVTSSFIFVTINYALGVGYLIKQQPKVAFYCAVFTVLWAVLTYDVSTLMAMYT